jgi:hypothetical protein
MRTPDVIDDFSMRGDRDRSQVAMRETGFLVTKKIVEEFAARPRPVRSWEFMQAAIPGELVGETEGAGGDLRLDTSKVGACPSEICIVWNPTQRRAEALSLDTESN